MVDTSHHNIETLKFTSVFSKTVGWRSHVMQTLEPEQN